MEVPQRGVQVALMSQRDTDSQLTEYGLLTIDLRPPKVDFGLINLTI